MKWGLVGYFLAEKYKEKGVGDLRVLIFGIFII